MGARSSKSRLCKEESRLCKEDLEFLKEKTRYDEFTITKWYKEFIQVNHKPPIIIEAKVTGLPGRTSHAVSLHEDLLHIFP